MDQATLIERIGAAFEPDQRVRALLLGGSYGRGTADAFSDVDLIALAAPADHDGIARAWRGLLEGIAPVVYWSERRFGSILVNAVTEDWLRCDLYIVPPDGLKGRARDTVRPLLDRDGLYEALPASLPPRQPNPDRVRGLIHEFIRVLGLLPVVVGREEYFTSVVGVGLQRDALMNLMLEEVTLPDPGGALHLSRILAPDQMQVLRALPCPKPDRAEVIKAHLEIARQFFPRARALAARLRLEWPERFEAATRRTLERHFGREADITW